MTSANRALVVEALRSAAELVVWGDRHDATLVDYFLEAGLLAHYADVLDSSASAPSSSGPSSSPSPPQQHQQPRQRPSPPRYGSPAADQPLAAQVLQSAAILVANVRSRAAAYYLFSGGGHLERLISSPQRRAERGSRGGGASPGGRVVLDLSDDEVAGQYVALLKAVAARLDEHTVQCFYHDGAGFPSCSGSSGSGAAAAPALPAPSSSGARSGAGQGQRPEREHEAPSFPLLDAARSLLSHREPLVRAAARALTLQIYSIPDEGVQAFVSGAAAAAAGKERGRKPTGVASSPSSSAAAACAAEAHFEGVARGVAELSSSMRLRLAAAEEALLGRPAVAAAAAAAAPGAAAASALARRVVAYGGGRRPPPTPAQALTALENVASELEDCLGYCHDVLVTRPGEAAAAAAARGKKQGAEQRRDDGGGENDDGGGDNDGDGFERVEAAPFSSSFDSSSGVSKLLQRSLWKHAIVPCVLEPLAALALGRAKSEEGGRERGGEDRGSNALLYPPPPPAASLAARAALHTAQILFQAAPDARASGVLARAVLLGEAPPWERERRRKEGEGGRDAARGGSKEERLLGRAPPPPPPPPPPRDAAAGDGSGLEPLARDGFRVALTSADGALASAAVLSLATCIEGWGATGGGDGGGAGGGGGTGAEAAATMDTLLIPPPLLLPSPPTTPRSPRLGSCLGEGPRRGSCSGSCLAEAAGARAPVAPTPTKTKATEMIPPLLLLSTRERPGGRPSPSPSAAEPSTAMQRGTPGPCWSPWPPPRRRRTRGAGGPGERPRPRQRPTSRRRRSRPSPAGPSAPPRPSPSPPRAAGPTRSSRLRGPSGC